MRHLEYKFYGNDLLLLADKACVHLRSNSLLLSDIHLGKDVSMQKEGRPIPHDHTFEDLQRIKRLINTYEVERVIILGDMIHNADSLSQSVVEGFASWRKQFDQDFVLVTGNHDRHMSSVPVSWELQQVDSMKERNLLLLHDHDEVENNDHPSIAGHTHPVVVLKSRFDRLRVPCFSVDGSRLTLPSFGSLTGGFELDIQKQSVVFAICEDRIHPVKTTHFQS